MPVNFSSRGKTMMKLGDRTVCINGDFGKISTRVAREALSATGSLVVYFVCVKSDAKVRIAICNTRGLDDLAESALSTVRALSREGWETFVEAHGKTIPITVLPAEDTHDELSDETDSDVGPSLTDSGKLRSTL